MPRVTRKTKEAISSSEDEEISNNGSSISLIDSSNESTQNESVSSDGSGVSFYVIKYIE